MNHLKPIEILEATVNAGVTKANSSFKKLLVLGILAGAVMTGIIQSSSASVGILQALSVTN